MCVSTFSCTLQGKEKVYVWWHLEIFTTHTRENVLPHLLQSLCSVATLSSQLCSSSLAVGKQSISPSSIFILHGMGIFDMMTKAGLLFPFFPRKWALHRCTLYVCFPHNPLWQLMRIYWMAKGISFYFAMNVQTRTITISIIMPARTPKKSHWCISGSPGLLYISPLFTL